MSMRGTSHRITICEHIREVNDEHQTDNPHDIRIRKICCVMEDMAKRMDKKLRENNKNYDKGWWEKNKDYEADLIRRENEKYCVG